MLTSTLPPTAIAMPIASPSHPPPSPRLPAISQLLKLLSLLPLLLVTPSLPLPAADLHPVATPGSFELHPALELSLFASEPDVVDPVALAFDELGRAWVVEMRDYPYGIGPDRRPGSTIRRLEDTDGDGRADRSTLFAEGLSFATSIAPWNGGVLVTAPPDILFLSDTNADGKADVRETILSGFHLGVTDSNVNGLRFAHDNWIHGANGGNGGSVRSRGGEPFRLGDRDFRFRPDTAALEPTTHTGGGFGLVFDAWGRSFTTYNINHAQQRVANASWFSRHPGLPAVETTHSISDHGDMARIFPVSPAVTRPNHPEQAGHFSAAGGLGFISHPAWPGDLPGSLLVCDVVGNLVHRDVLSPDGPVFRASRAPGETNREFFASRDNEFRPVGLESGPDGALYLLDMQREVIEHPDYIPKKSLEKLDLRAGDDRGRIYRIAPRGWPTTRELPGTLPPARQVALLTSSNLWTRLTVQRLLITRRHSDVVPALSSLARDASPHGRFHALRTLSGLDALDSTSLDRALHDSVPALRVNALHLLATRPTDLAQSRNAIRSLLGDANAEVRFTAALVSGLLDPPPTAELVTLLQRDHRFPWSRRAALAALGPSAVTVEPNLFGDTTFWSNPDPARLSLASEFAEVAAASGDFHLPTHLRNLPPSIQAAVLEGTTRGLARRSAPPDRIAPDVPAVLEAIADAQPSPTLLAAAFRLGRHLRLPRSAAESARFDHWLAQATNTALPTPQRVEIVKFLAVGDPPVTSPTLQRLLHGTEPGAIQRAALDVLRDHRDPSVGEALVKAWTALPPSLRPDVVQLLVYRPSFHEPLLAALENGTLQIGELNLDLEHRRQLLRKARPSIRDRAARFMSDEEYSNRIAAVDAWLPRLPAQGDPDRGKPVFERLCAQCHHAAGLGFRVGPDLTGLSHRSVEDLLSNILDPNMAMNPAFVATTAELTDDESESGILTSENDRAITLSQAGGRTIEIPRTRIRELRSGGKSLMPEGLEAGLTPAGLRDLIAFLQTPTPP